jgi:hypothetical protein
MLSHCCFDYAPAQRRFTMAARTNRALHVASDTRCFRYPSAVLLQLPVLLRGIQALSIDTNLSETINVTLSSIQPSIDLKRDNLTLLVLSVLQRLVRG